MLVESIADELHRSNSGATLRMVRGQYPGNVHIDVSEVSRVKS
jgi:hypothetical protein